MPMRDSPVASALFALLLLVAGGISAAEPYRMDGLILLQPESTLRERVPGGAPAMQAYIEAINAAATRIVAASEAQRPSAGFVVLAVRPGRRAKVWLDFWPLLPSRTEQRLLPALEKVAPFDARGLVVFAIDASLWGAAPTRERAPRPNEWTRVTRERGAATDAETIVDALWPDRRSAPPAEK